MLAPAPIPQQPITLHDVECVRSRKAANVKIEGVAPEEFGISRNARSLRDCDYAFHKILISRAKLLAQGFDENQVKTLSPYTVPTNTEEIERDTVNEYQYRGDEANESAQRIEVTEHYVRMDYEGNGKPCLYLVTTGGSQGDILTKDGKPDIRQIDAIPLAAMTPVIVTHRFFGRSIADLVMDIQRIKTALMRAVLDNAYLAVNPRVEVAESHASSETLDDLLVSRPGGIVRTKQPGGINWQAIPNIAAEVFPVLEYMDSTREFRSGVTRQGQGIDADALQNQSATAVNQLYSAAQAKMRLIARIFAETGIRDMFQLVHATIRKHGQQAQTVRLRNKWVTVDPRTWKNRYDMTVHVGLGHGGRQEQAAIATQTLSIQKEMLAGGKSNIVNDKNLYNAAKAFTKAAGHKNADDYFTDPTETGPDGQLLHPPPPPQPSPEMVKAQAAQQQQQGQLAITQAKTQADAAHQVMKTQADIALEQQKFEHDKQLAFLNHGLAVEAHRMNMVKTAADIAAKQVGPDGKPAHVDIDKLLSSFGSAHHAPQQHAAPPKMKVVRDQGGRVSHLEPMP